MWDGHSCPQPLTLTCCTGVSLKRLVQFQSEATSTAADKSVRATQPGIDDDCYRPIVHQFYLHIGLKPSRLNLQPSLADAFCKKFIQFARLFSECGLDERGTRDERLDWYRRKG